MARTSSTYEFISPNISRSIFCSFKEGGGDRWLKWEVNDLQKHAKEATLKLSVLRADELIDFPAFFQRVLGRAPPAVLYFAQGAQFAASRSALRSTPKETYQWILELVEAGHFEVTFYLEMIWYYLLHGAPEADWDPAIMVDRKEAAPFLNHLMHARSLRQANGDRRSLLAIPSPSPEPEDPPPLLPPLPHGVSGTAALIGDTLSVRQEGARTQPVCAFDLFLFIPSSMTSSRKSDQFVGDMEIQVLAGSSWRGATSSAVLTRDVAVHTSEVGAIGAKIGPPMLPPPLSPPSLPRSPPPPPLAPVKATADTLENQQSGDGSRTAVIAIIASICALAVLVAFAFMRRLCNRKMTVTAKQVDANFRITSDRDSSSSEGSPAALRDACVEP